MIPSFTRPGLAAVFLLVLACCPQLEALTINLTYDSTVTSLPNAAAYEAACQYAATQLGGYFTDNITINITVTCVPDQSVFGMSGFPLVGSSYAEIRNALISHATSANDHTAITNDVPATDPTGGGNFYVNTALAKALGIIGPSAQSDGTFTFGAGYSFALDPTHRAVAGEYDFVGVAEHEMSEIMGRSAGLGTDFGDGGPDYIPYDLFRYSGSGVRSIGPGANNYFSIDGGVTNLKTFNFPNGNGSDPQDWAPGTNDACNNASLSGVENDFSTVDITAMDVMGYTTAAAPVFTDGPPPSSANPNTAYSFTYTASGSPAPTFALATGSLPSGLSLTTAGLLSGTPNTPGTYTGTVRASNSVGSVTQSFSITVGQSSQTITFAALSDRTAAQSPFTVSATASSGLAVTFSVASGPATISGNTVTLNGTGTITIQADQAGNATYSAAPSVTQTFHVTGGTPFSQWATDNGISNTPTATPENDGVPNLLKYLFNIDPAVPITAADHEALPVFSLATSGSTTYLTLTYRQYAMQTGLTINVEVSPDLKTWTIVSNPAFVETGLDSVTSDPILQVAVPTTGGQRFIRLDVTSP